MSLVLISEKHLPCIVHLPAEPIGCFLRIGLCDLTDLQTTKPSPPGGVGVGEWGCLKLSSHCL